MSKKIVFQCNRCGHRLFDYIGGNFVIEIKCTKCKRFLAVKGKAYSELVSEAKDGVYRI